MPFQTLLRGLVIASVSISVFIFYVLHSLLLTDLPVYRLIFIASFITSASLWGILSPAGFRFTLKVLRKFNPVIYADLNGTWEGAIRTSEGQNIEVKAVVRQSLLKTEIDVHGKTIKSITLAAATKIEAGQYKLYYIYRAEPKDSKWPIYQGTTKFDLRKPSPTLLSLSGQYYTDRKTTGNIELRQEGTDPLKDVSYY